MISHWAFRNWGLTPGWFSDIPVFKKSLDRPAAFSCCSFKTYFCPFVWPSHHFKTIVIVKQPTKCLIACKILHNCLLSLPKINTSAALSFVNIIITQTIFQLFVKILQYEANELSVSISSYLFLPQIAGSCHPFKCQTC